MVYKSGNVKLFDMTAFDPITYRKSTWHSLRIKGGDRERIPVDLFFWNNDPLYTNNQAYI